MSLSDWQAALAAANKGGLRADGTPLVLAVQRGDRFAQTVKLAGDWSAATVAGQVRNWPDSDEEDDPLASFGCEVGDYDGSAWTPVTVTLAAEDTAGLPPAPARAAFRDFPAALTLTPAGGNEELLLGFTLRAIGRVPA